jgi:hypothetical protein
MNQILTKYLKKTAFEVDDLELTFRLSPARSLTVLKEATRIFTATAPELCFVESFQHHCYKTSSNVFYASLTIDIERVRRTAPIVLSSPAQKAVRSLYRAERHNVRRRLNFTRRRTADFLNPPTQQKINNLYFNALRCSACLLPQFIFEILTVFGVAYKALMFSDIPFWVLSVDDP